MVALKIAAYVVFLLCQPVAVVMAAFMLPGSVLVVLTALLVSAATGWTRPSWQVLIALAVMAIIAELADNLASMLGVRQFGGSRSTSVAAGLGALAGAVVASMLAGTLGLGALLAGPMGWIFVAVGVPLLGAFAGGFAVAYFLELRRGAPTDAARRAGWGAIMGRVLGAVAKVSLTGAMSIVAVLAAFWPAS